MIVRDYDHERHLFDGGYVQTFLRSSRLHSPFADCRQADKSVLALHPLRQQLADHHRNHRAEVTDHRQLVLQRPATMNISVSTAHRTFDRSEIRAYGIEQWFAK